MAKKMSKSSQQTAPQEFTSKKEDNMVSKVEVKKPQDQEQVSRVVGTIFIVLGVVLVGLGIFSYIKYRENPEFDGSLESPSILSEKSLTNSKEIVLKGNADDYDQVYVYVDGNEVDLIKVSKDGSFEYTYGVESEGKYAFSVAGVKGFPKRVMSAQSSRELIEVDWTAPELVSVDYKGEVGTETFTIVGKSEPYAEVFLKRGVDSYTSSTDENGDFKIAKIGLEEGPNVFNLEIKDTAGNIAKVDEKVKVTYTVGGSVNGDAVVDGSDLPVAAGSLSEAQDMLLGNRLMMIFGLLSIFGFIASGVYVSKKQNA